MSDDDMDLDAMMASDEEMEAMLGEAEDNDDTAAAAATAAGGRKADVENEDEDEDDMDLMAMMSDGDSDDNSNNNPAPSAVPGPSAVPNRRDSWANPPDDEDDDDDMMAMLDDDDEDTNNSAKGGGPAAAAAAAANGGDEDMMGMLDDDDSSLDMDALMATDEDEDEQPNLQDLNEDEDSDLDLLMMMSSDDDDDGAAAAPAPAVRVIAQQSLAGAVVGAEKPKPAPKTRYQAVKAKLKMPKKPKAVPPKSPPPSKAKAKKRASSSSSVNDATTGAPDPGDIPQAASLGLSDAAGLVPKDLVEVNSSERGVPMEQLKPPGEGKLEGTNQNHDEDDADGSLSESSSTEVEDSDDDFDDEDADIAEDKGEATNIYQEALTDAKDMLDMTRQQKMLEAHLSLIDKSAAAEDITEDGELTLEDGSIYREHKNGLKEKRKPNGDIIYQMKNGSIVRADKRGNKVVKLKDTTVLQQTHDKNFLCQLPDGVQLQNLEGGIFILRLEPSERRIEWEKDEELISYLKEDGDPYKEIDYREECVIDFRDDGTKVAVFSDGVQVVVYKDGRKVQFDPNTGIRIEAWPDGRRIETHRDGHSVEIAADGTRTDYDADGNIITRASEKRAAQAFNVEELKKKHAKDDREDETANDSTGGDGGAAAKSESLDLDLDRLISEFQLSANLKSTFESSELESHLYTVKSIHDKYEGHLTGEALLAEGTPAPVVQALTTILGVSLTDTIAPADYLGGMKTIYTIDASGEDKREVKLVPLESCTMVQVGIVLSNWGLSKMVPIFKNATVDGRALSNILSVKDVLRLAPLSSSLVDRDSNGEISETELTEAARGSVLSRLVDKVALCRANDGMLSRSISIMMHNMQAGGAGKGKKGQKKAALFKSLEMQKKSHDLYANYFSAASIQSLLAKKASPNWNNPEDNGNTVLMLATKTNKAPVVRLLLEGKANPNMANNANTTPLHLACRHGRLNLVKLLILHKANVSQRNAHGSAIDEAMRKSPKKAVQTRRNAVLSFLQAMSS